MTNTDDRASCVPNLAAIKLRDLDAPGNAEQIAAVRDRVDPDRDTDQPAVPVAAFNASL